MAKFIVYTTCYHEKGLKPTDEMRDNVKSLSPAEDIFCWKMDVNHHQSITIYSSEYVGKKHRAKLEEFRKKSSSEYLINMVEETMGPLIA